MTKLKLSYFGHITRREGSLEKIIMLRRIEGSRKKGRPNMKCVGSIKRAIGMSLQELSRAMRTGHCGHLSFIGSPRVSGDSVAWNLYTTQNR